MRDKLIELLESVPTAPDGSVGVTRVADHLLANGVIVPPCKVGDTVYVVIPDFDEVKNGEVTRLEYDMYRTDGAWIETSIGETCLPLLRLNVPLDHIGVKTVFLTREEAERALREVQE